MFAEAIHVKDIEQSNLQEKNQSWVMLSNGGYIHKELANTQGEHLFHRGPKLPLLYHAMRLLQIKFHASVFYGIDIIVFGSTSLCDICYLQIIHMLRRNNSYWCFIAFCWVDLTLLINIWQRSQELEEKAKRINLQIVSLFFMDGLTKGKVTWVLRIQTFLFPFKQWDFDLDAAA